MKIYLKGGTVFEVDLSNQVFIVIEGMLRVFDRNLFNSAFARDAVNDNDNLILPFSYVERIEV